MLAPEAIRIIERYFSHRRPEDVSSAGAWSSGGCMIDAEIAKPWVAQDGL
jgi:hypothetical protein